ncbi:hypothetical protein QWZ14_30035, partial [Paeniroseomonas aquatica]
KVDNTACKFVKQEFCLNNNILWGGPGGSADRAIGSSGVAAVPRHAADLTGSLRKIAASAESCRI